MIVRTTEVLESMRLARSQTGKSSSLGLASTSSHVLLPGLDLLKSLALALALMLALMLALQEELRQ